MGGYHVTGRQNKGGLTNYIALNSYFKVPKELNADQSTESYPEFLYSLWRGSYGIDVGLGYGFKSKGKTTWAVFAHANATVFGYDANQKPITWKECPTPIYLQRDQVILMAVIIEEKIPSIKITLTYEGNAKPFLDYNFDITPKAHEEMIKGCTFVREALLATNSTTLSYINTNGAFYRFAKWYRGSLTRKLQSGAYAYDPLVGDLLVPRSDDNIFEPKRICTYRINESWPGDPIGDGFGCECSTASFKLNYADVQNYNDWPGCNG